MGLASVEAEDPLDGKPGIHARDYGKLLGWRHRQMPQVELLNVSPIRCQIIFIDSHRILLFGLN
jgi:hypothetical protein